MMYRALANLGIGNKIIRKGDIFPSSRLRPENLIILESQNKVAPANLPPVAVLPRLKSKRAALAKQQVITAGDFLEADNAALAAAMRINEAEIRQIKAELYAQFNPPKPTG